MATLCKDELRKGVIVPDYDFMVVLPWDDPSKEITAPRDELTIVFPEKELSTVVVVSGDKLAAVLSWNKLWQLGSFKLKFTG